MEAYFRFQMPEEREDFELHMQASSFNAAIHDYDIWLRNICKHGDPSEYTAAGCRAMLYECLNKYGVTIK